MANNFWEVVEQKLEDKDLIEFKKRLEIPNFTEMIKAVTEFLESAIKTEHSPFSNDENELLIALRILIYRNIEERFATVQKSLVEPRKNLSDIDRTVNELKTDHEKMINSPAFELMPEPQRNEIIESYKQKRAELRVERRTVIKSETEINSIMNEKIDDLKTMLKTLDEQMAGEKTIELAAALFQKMFENFGEYQRVEQTKFERKKLSYQIHRLTAEKKRKLFIDWQSRNRQNNHPVWHWAQRNKDLLNIE